MIHSCFSQCHSLVFGDCFPDLSKVLTPNFVADVDTFTIHQGILAAATGCLETSWWNSIWSQSHSQARKYDRRQPRGLPGLGRCRICWGWKSYQVFPGEFFAKPFKRIPINKSSMTHGKSPGFSGFFSWLTLARATFHRTSIATRIVQLPCNLIW